LGFPKVISAAIDYSLQQGVVHPANGHHCVATLSSISYFKLGDSVIDKGVKELSAPSFASRASNAIEQLK